MNTNAKSIKAIERLNLRLALEVFALIDQARAMRPGKVSRNTWIAEAIQEKLAREMKGDAVRTQLAQGGG